MSAKIQNRFRSLVVEVVALIILVPLSIFLFTKLSSHQQKDVLNVAQSPTVTSATPQATATSANTSPPSSPVQQPIGSQITLKIFSPEKNYTYKIPTEKSLSVIDVMKTAEKHGMTLKTKDYGASLGILIEEINNVSNDSKNQKYWTLYVNDKMSAMGASFTTVNPGETVTWKFENTTL